MELYWMDIIASTFSTNVAWMLTVFPGTWWLRIRIEMWKDLYWLNGSWPGKLAVAPRPRGGDWLADDIATWKREGINAVLSLLTPDEEREMGLRGEAGEVKTQGMEFISFPIPDLQIPRSEAKWAELLERVALALSSDKNVLIHCRQGIGRSGLAAACLLVKKGMSPGAAVESASAARGLSVPQTPEQREWIEQYAVALAGMQ
jgi:protein-tyrosine phosphatase